MENVRDWSELKLNKQLVTAVNELAFAHPTEIQLRCIPLILGGQQVIGIAQTGTGKTAAYMLPLLMKARFAQGEHVRILVLAPTKELVVQLATHAQSLARHTDLRVVPIYGGVGPKTQIEQMKLGVDILVATPGRFMELYRLGEIVTKQINTLVLDEADRMMDMGFMHQLRTIFEVIPRKRQNLLFSATFSAKVEQLSQSFLDHPVKVEVTPQATASVQVEQELYRIPNLKTKINFLERMLADRETFSRVLIFTRSKETADNVFKYLDRKNLGPVRVVHSNKGQNSRINAVQEFRDGIIRVLVSTDVTARGIDVNNVSHVINFDVPMLYEDYVHRIGRTGRAFQTGKAITFCTEAEVYHIQKIEAIIHARIPVKTLPSDVEVEPTPFEEQQVLLREIDRQRRLEDPDYQGAFHARKGK